MPIEQLDSNSGAKFWRKPDLAAALFGAEWELKSSTSVVLQQKKPAPYGVVSGFAKARWNYSPEAVSAYIKVKAAIGAKISSGTFTHLLQPKPGLHLLVSGFSKILKVPK